MEAWVGGRMSRSPRSGGGAAEGWERGRREGEQKEEEKGKKE